MVTLAPVDAPAPERPLINLLGAANTPGGAGRWQEGTEYEATCPHVWLADVCEPDTTAEVLAGVGPDDPEGRRVAGVAVYAVTDYDCIALPNLLDTYRDRVLAAADAELPRAVEHELWTGAIAVASALPQRFLASGDSLDLTPVAGAVSPNRAVGMLERAVGMVYSGVALIHATRDVVPFVSHTSRTGRIIETRTGNRLVPGVGYTGTGPDGNEAAAGEVWLYATPMVTVRVGDTAINDRVDVDRDTNRAHIVARTPFEVTWDGCTPAFAVRALLP